jgi:hypothetical protein
MAVGDVGEAAAVVTRWLGSATTARDAGAHALALVQSGVGAAERAFTLVERLLTAP